MDFAGDRPLSQSMIHHASHPITTVQPTRSRVEQQPSQSPRGRRKGRGEPRRRYTYRRLGCAGCFHQRRRRRHDHALVAGRTVDHTSDSTGRLSGSPLTGTPGRRGRYSDHGGPTFGLDGGEVDANLRVDERAVDGEGSDGEQLRRTSVAACVRYWRWSAVRTIRGRRRRGRRRQPRRGRRCAMRAVQSPPTVRSPRGGRP